MNEGHEIFACKIINVELVLGLSAIEIVFENEDVIVITQ